MKQPKKAPKRNVAARLGLPSEGMPGIAQVLLLGDTRLRATPCLRLLCYQKNEIRAQIGKRVLCVCGNDLRIEVFCAQTLEICGQIEAIRWQEVAQ